jgi:hypothetical protein
MRGENNLELFQTFEYGFSIFDELIQNQGEVALIIEGNGEDWKFVKYTNPKRRRIFEEGEVRNAYLSQTMSNKTFEDKDRATLTEYLEKNGWNLPVNQQRLDNTVERGQRSAFKYKPVALKVKQFCVSWLTCSL